MRSTFYVLRSTFFRILAGLLLTAFFTFPPARKARAEGSEAVLEASTIEGASEAAREARAAEPDDAAAAYLAGVVDSIAGRPRAAFDAFGQAVRLAVASGTTRDALVAGLSLDELLGLVAYLPRDEIAALEVPDPQGNDPWWLWARLARVRLRLAVAAITDDVPAIEDARNLLGCGPQAPPPEPRASASGPGATGTASFSERTVPGSQPDASPRPGPWRTLGPMGRLGTSSTSPDLPLFAPLPAAQAEPGALRWIGRAPQCLPGSGCTLRCGPVFSTGGPGFPGVHVAETDLVVAAPSRILVAVAGPERFALTLDGQPALAADPALGGPSQHWLVVDLPAGTHRLRIEVASDGVPVLEVEFVLPATDRAVPAVRVVPAVGAEPDLGAGVQLHALAARDALGATYGDATLLDLWLATSVARMAGDGDQALRTLDEIAERSPRGAVMWNALADEVWSGDLLQELRVERLHEMLDAQPEAFEGAYATALVRVGLLYVEGRADQALAALLEAVGSFPDDPGPGLVDARLAIERGELERAETSLEAARHAAGESCRTTDVAADLAHARGDDAAALSWLQAFEGCEPSRSGLVGALVRASQPQEADAANRRGVRVVGDVLHYQRWRMLEDLAYGAPSAGESALGVLQLAPDDEQATRAVYDALLAQGRADEAAQTLATLLPLQPGPRIDLRLIAEGVNAGWPLRESGLALALGNEARGTDDAPARLAVLDQVVVRLYADGSSVLRVHRIERAGTPASADDLGQVDVPAGALILALRTIHADGTIEYAGDRVGSTAYPLIGFGAGDYAEVEYVLQRAASTMFPGGTVLEPFYFSAPDESLERSEYVILAPPAMELSVDAGPGAPGGERADIGGLAVHRWLARDVRPQVVEPWAPDAVDVLPNVRACVGCTIERAARWLGASVARRGRVDPGMAGVVAEAQAAPDGAARALYRWVVHNVRSAPLPGDTARDVFLRGEGDRSLLLAHLARQAGLEAELWYASPASRGTPAAGLWLDGDYAVPLVRLDGQWLYAEENAVPFGALPPNVAGRPAARVSPAWGEEAVAAVEDPPSEFRLEAFAGPEGGVEVEAEARLFGLAATAMRQALEEEGEGEQPEELVRVYALPAFARDASITVVAVENADDVEAPLVVRAHVRLHAGPRGRPELSVRHRWQDRFALMVQRTQPLLLPVSVREEWTIVAQVAAGAEAAVLPLEIEMPFGTFRQWLERSAAAGTLVVRRSLRLPAQRIVPADYESFRSFAAAVDAATEPSVSLVASPGTR